MGPPAEEATAPCPAAFVGSPCQARLTAASIQPQQSVNRVRSCRPHTLAGDEKAGDQTGNENENLLR